MHIKLKIKFELEYIIKDGLTTIDSPTIINDEQMFNDFKRYT